MANDLPVRLPITSREVANPEFNQGKERPWRVRYRTQLASFKGAPFHVEQQSRSSGRRIVEHEYPKRDMPWSEDMGRHAIRYTITGYVIEDDRGPAFYQDYQQSKNLLIAKLEEPEPGVLVDPYRPAVDHLGYGGKDEILLFQCERYSVTETRERGGYAAFEMTFVEAGIAANTTIYEFADAKVRENAKAMEDAAVAELNAAMPTTPPPVDALLQQRPILPPWLPLPPSQAP